MNKNYNSYPLVFFLITSFFINVGINTLSTINKTDAIIDIIIGSIFIMIFLLIILWLKSKYDSDIINTIASFKYLKYPLSIFLLIILSISTIYSIDIISNFIHSYMLKELDTFTISITIIVTAIHLVSKGIKTISRISELCLYIYLFIFILGFIGLYNYIDIKNVKPLLTSNINSHLKASFTFFNYSILPIFLILGLKEKNNKSIIKTTIFSLLIIFIQSLLIISILGIDLTNIYINPDIIIYKKISFLNLLERVEVFLSFNQLLNSLFIITINLYLIKEIILVNIKKKKESIILTLLSILFLFLSNTLNINKSIYKTVNFSLIFLVIILVIRTIGYKYILHLEDQF